MTPLLHPFLVNDPFGDPAVYVEFKFTKRALLFDLGDLRPLNTRKILRLSDVFVSHMHVDHFIGFDQVLRVLLGRDHELRLYGPAGFLAAVEHRLASYTWNLVDRYPSDLRLTVTEVISPVEARSAQFRLQNRFRREAENTRHLTAGIVLDDGTICVRAAVLDHGIPCLAYAVAETAHINVWKNRLRAMNLPVGAWLRALKDAVLRGEPDETEIRAWWTENGTVKERFLPLGLLKKRALRIVPGQKIAYVVDVAFSQENIQQIIALGRGADTLFIEACFTEADTERAALRRHLTTAQAGYLARLAAVRHIEPFHFSPRYLGEEARLRREVAEAFAGLTSVPVGSGK